MTSTESARAGRHAAADDSDSLAPSMSADEAANYLLRRRGTESVSAPDTPAAHYPVPLPVDGEAPDLGYTPALPLSSFEDYVHPDYAQQWQRQKSRHGGLIALLLIVLLAVGGGGYWYFEMRVTGIPYRSDAGHFSARFPHKPQSEVRAETVNGYPVHEVFVVDEPGKTAAGSLSFDSAPPTLADGDAAALELAMVGAARSAELTSKSEKATRFDGKAARVGQFADETGEVVTLLIVKYSDTRFYFLFAEPGKRYNNLKKSFTMLP
ncbi:MAG TPA: hypothetical protein VJ831_00900 [Jatrophihabitantaceae bacterium]|nr:hypothetical protein [Jatrophihabitantaceae bacterium]